MGKRTRKSQKTRPTRLGGPATARASTKRFDRLTAPSGSALRRAESKVGGLNRTSPAVTKGRSRSREMQELVVVTTAETMEEAKEYETLLKNNDIPAMVRQQPNEFGEGKHYAVIAPEDMADEAHVVIESQDAYDDFYDSGLDEETEEDFEGDIFEDGS